MNALEIGIGGGRVAKRVAPLVKSVNAVDISGEMIKKAKKNLAHLENITYHHSEVSP
jgi:ubiquinone/menaquinone biosynthesis C-methylase UbiE